MRLRNYILYKITSEYRFQEQTLNNVSSLFDYKINIDNLGNQFVVLNCVGESDGAVLPYSVDNKTQYEAVINHVHICEKISKKDIESAASIADNLIHGIYAALKSKYPERKFVVAATINEKDSFIIRFHQKWENEAPYYDKESFDNTSARLLVVQDDD